jgi:hypothetical protein
MLAELGMPRAAIKNTGRRSAQGEGNGSNSQALYYLRVGETQTSASTEWKEGWVNSQSMLISAFCLCNLLVCKPHSNWVARARVGVGRQ